MSYFSFKPWRDFQAVKDESVIRRFLNKTADESVKAFRKGMRSAKAGKKYRGRSGRTITASAPGQYPAIDTGELDASIGTRTTASTVTIGTNMFYSKFLRFGTRSMARRRMSDDALTEGVKAAEPALKGFVKWKRT